MVAGVFVKRQRCCQHTATTVRHTDHIQVTLQDSVLTRCTVDRDIRKIEGLFLSCARKRKIILIDGLSGLGVPVLPVKHHDGDIVALLVHEGVDTRCRTQRHLVFTTVSACYNGYFSLHLFIV